MGIRADARAIGRLLPDCAVLLSRLVRDRRVARRHKALLALLAGYLALPFDLVPDFIPGVGQVDDALIVAFALRAVVRGAGSDLVREHWPGPPAGLDVLLRLTAAERPGSARAA